MGFSGPEYWSGEPFPSPGDLPNPGINPGSPASQADASPAEPPGEPLNGEDDTTQGVRRALSRAGVSGSLRPRGLWPARLRYPWGPSSQEHWSELPFPSPGDLPNPGIDPGSPALEADV